MSTTHKSAKNNAELNDLTFKLHMCMCVYAYKYVLKHMERAYGEFAIAQDKKYLELEVSMISNFK